MNECEQWNPSCFVGFENGPKRADRTAQLTDEGEG